MRRRKRVKRRRKGTMRRRKKRTSSFHLRISLLKLERVKRGIRNAIKERERGEERRRGRSNEGHI
jgi:hypothetical protein